MKSKVIILAVIIIALLFSPRWGITGCYRSFGAGYSCSRSGERLAKLSNPWETGSGVAYQTGYGWKPSVAERTLNLFLPGGHTNILNELKTCEGK